MHDSAQGSSFALGCDIGATKISLALAFEPGKIVDRVLDLTKKVNGPEELTAQLSAMIGELLGRNKLSMANCVGLGIAFAGMVDASEGRVIYGPNLGGWENVPLKSMLEARFTVPVLVRNDANMGALGEYRHGGLAGGGDMLYMTVSTGIGAGVIIGGRSYEGANSVAGEIGHVTVADSGPLCGCGKHGCLEAMASGLSIERIANERMKSETTSLTLRASENGGRVNSAIVFEEARKGDTLSTELVESACRYIGLALAGAVMLMSFSTVVLGGGMAKEGEYLREKIDFYTRKELAKGPNSAVRILVSGKPESVVDLGIIDAVFDAHTESKRKTTK